MHHTNHFNLSEETEDSCAFQVLPFEDIYRSHAPELIEYASKRLENLSEAEDVIQDVFTDLWSKKDQLRISCSIRAYLYAAVRYKVVDHIRRNIQRDYYARMVKALRTEEDNATFNQVVYRDLEQHLETEIEKLPARTQQVFHMSRKDHLTVKEIASRLEVTDQTVKNQLTTAVKRLRPAFYKLFFFIMVLFMWPIRPRQAGMSAQVNRVAGSVAIRVKDERMEAI